VSLPGLAAAMVFALAVGAPASAAGAAPRSCPGLVRGVGFRLVDIPNGRIGDPRATAYIIDHLKPGSTIRRRIELINGTRVPARVQLYPAAATIAGGMFRFGAGRATNELTAWTSVAPGQVVVGACRRAAATVAVAVPSGARTGERYATVWAELPASGKRGTSLLQVTRIGIRAYLSVGPGPEPASNFVIRSLSTRRDRPGRVTIAALARNTGGRAVDLSGDLRLDHGPDGGVTPRFEAQSALTLAPGESGSLSFPLGKRVAAGRWTATVELRSGRLTRRAVGRIDIPTKPSKGTAVQVDMATPGIGMAVVSGAGALAALLLVLFTIRRARQLAAIAPSHLSGRRSRGRAR
jgi:hypothetical protein